MFSVIDPLKATSFDPWLSLDYLIYMRIKNFTSILTISFFLFCGVIFSTWAGSPSLEYLNNILKGTEQNIDKNLKRLSGGIRLLSDDPANYAIYQRLEANIRQIDKEIENSTSLISYYQYGEGLLGSLIDSLQRIRELAVMRQNSIYTKEDVELVDAEIKNHYDHVLFLLKTAEFNRIYIFKSFFCDTCFSDLFQKESYLQLENVDRLLDFFITQRSEYGVKINLLEHTRKQQMVEEENEQGFQSTLLDVNFGEEMSLLKRNHLLFLINVLLL
jgi:flagellin-like hook-associated protein FlgL